MNGLKWIVSVLALTFLTACSEDNSEKTKTTVEDESAVGFELNDGAIEEAQNIPNEDKEALISTFNHYIDAFNEQNINAYMDVLSSNPKGFNLDEEREAVETAFSTYSITRNAEDVTIIKYSESEANVFSNLKTDLVEKETGTEHVSEGRQVTVFSKENGNWKVSSVYYIGSEE